MAADALACARAQVEWRDDRVNANLDIRLDLVAPSRARVAINDMRVTGGDRAVVAEIRGDARATGKKFQIAEG